MFETYKSATNLWFWI